MTAAIDLTGHKYGRLTVIKYCGNKRQSSNGRTYRYWLCRCDCGKEVEVSTEHLRSGNTKSCGCYSYELSQKLNYQHGMTDTRLHVVWKNMKRRCYCSDLESYKNYGGRGIKICDEWKNDFLAFYKWSIENGYDENAKHGECTLDRIDNNGDYEPSNCRWVNMYVQTRNTRRNRYIEFNGKRLTICEWGKEIGGSSTTVLYRINKGWAVEEALLTPVGKRNWVPKILQTDDGRVRDNKMNFIKFIGYFTNPKDNLTNIAERIGITPSCLTDWKKGISHPNEEHMKKITDYLKVEANYFL